MSSVFLRAEWRRLVMANYLLDPQVLKPYLPACTELDLWNNNCYISLVGFMFCNTRVLGMAIPWHRNFEEVNLRFYVRYKEGDEWKRGVVFIKEIVPRRAITFVANNLYGEHYITLPMRHTWQENTDQLEVAYEWKWKGHWNRLAVETASQAQDITPGSEAEFITEHYWGYTRLTAERTSEYQVEHPCWQVYPVKQYDIDCDAYSLYGSAFGEVMRQAPASVFLAEGSDILVRGGRVFKRDIF
ncbi:MAG: hypothetical protein DHS20C18_02260 [Saprospiraceae bacterium]|nr:MAG: hypothetical protein DHS20C18_02260 [Saprospiraceae bacterium]